TQFLQAEGLRYGVEANRRRKFRNSGSLPWQFNEPYPMAACTSAVDYYAIPKPVYYAVARAYAPLLVSARFARITWDGATPFCAAVWSNSSSGTQQEGLTLRTRLIDAAGNEMARTEQAVSLAPNAAQELAHITAARASTAHDVFFLDLALLDEGGNVRARNC